MPRGAKPGERRGGRVKGTLNRKTIEKVAAAQYREERAKAKGQKLAKDILRDFMTFFAGRAAHYQPGGPEPKEEKFVEFAKLAVDAAKALAPFESPTYRAIAVHAPDGAEGRKLPAIIDMTVNDPIEVAEAYRQLMASDEATPVGSG